MEVRRTDAVLDPEARHALDGVDDTLPEGAGARVQHDGVGRDGALPAREVRQRGTDGTGVRWRSQGEGGSACRER